MKKNFMFFVSVIISITSTIIQPAFAQWNLTGNSNASITSKLGTTNSIPLVIFTKNLERVRIDTFGRVGIGTAVPNSRLQVNSLTGQNSFSAQVNGSTKFLVSSNGGASIGSASTAPANGLFVNGNTGIGTSAPVAKLHVVGSSLFTANLKVSEGGITTNNSVGDGIIGTGSGNGVYGNGTSNGVYGVGTSGSYGFGVRGIGFVGVYAESNSISGDAIRGYAFAASEYGVNAYSQQSFGVYGSTGSSTSYGGYFIGGVYSSNGVYASSDRSLKENIVDMTSGMDLIKKLQPKTYIFRQDGNYKLMNLPIGKQYGLIAQDVEQVLPQLVKETTFEPGKSGRIKQDAGASQTITFKALNYTELIPIVVKGMQEQQTQITNQDAQIQELTITNENLQSQINELKAMIVNGNSGALTAKIGYLKQNIPNPATNSTVIGYYIPNDAGRAEIRITDAKGSLLKTYTAIRGGGQLSITSGELPEGVYNYTLYSNNKVIDTKQMVIIR